MPSSTAANARPVVPRTITVLSVRGMDCGRCEKAAKARLKALDGVIKVTARTLTGEITLGSEHPLDEGTVRAATETLGFTVIALTVRNTGAASAG
ncbi:heavy-metal-associated domain-containing protein [Kitasatospora sp. NPDC052896]|uniref:heavy-metal-associated domain-containing protein n=1 Tax=Kitasatospora sp. NPDC052896 TaxID=3364061 RepID=UPI0037CB1CC8